MKRRKTLAFVNAQIWKIRVGVMAIFLALVFAAGALSVANAIGPWTNQKTAGLVLGQATFTTNTSATSQTKFRSPSTVAVDPTTGKVFVSELGNHRVLRFASGDALTNGAAAEAVLGQPNFTSAVAATTQSGMNTPFLGLIVDANGRLWVSDTYNHRVLRFDNASTKADGANADGVLGQPDFTSKASATTQSGFNQPDALFMDTNGNLWVTDAYNHRVLRFDNAASKPNGGNADAVLGQPDFTSKTTRTTQNGMNAPDGIIMDGSGHLWVAEFANNRVLRFDNAAAKANGANADAVLGQDNFTTATSGAAQNRMSSPYNITLDSAGRLYVADKGNNRILIFNDAATLANGANADNVLGQSNFTSSIPNNGGLSDKTLNNPVGVFFDPAADVLWVADWFNHRVLRYGSPTTTTLTSSLNPSGFGQSVTFTAIIAPVSGSGTPSGTVAFKDGTNAITGCEAQVLSAGQATCSTVALALGDHTISAVYSGDTDFGISTGSLTGNPQVVIKINTTTTLTSSQNPSAPATAVTFTALVAPVSGSGTPSGTVAFKDGTSTITGCEAQVLSAGQATCSTSSLAVGDHTITADYGGDASYNASTGEITEVIQYFKVYFPCVRAGVIPTK